jgi:hypothetical protein
MGCGDRWTQQQWIEAAEGRNPAYEGDYKLVGKYVNSQGNVAVVVQDTDSMPYTRIIWNESGSETQTIRASDEESGAAALQEALELLADNGYVKQEDSKGVQYLVTMLHAIVADTPLNTIFDLLTEEENQHMHDLATSETEIVEGVTLKQWITMGEMNDSALAKMVGGHAHPSFEGRDYDALTEVELVALVNSMTTSEKTTATRMIIEAYDLSPTLQRNASITNIVNTVRGLLPPTSSSLVLPNMGSQPTFEQLGAGFFGGGL